MARAVPNNPEDLGDVLRDPKRMAELLEEPANLETFMVDYAEAFQKADVDKVQSEVKHQTTEALEDMYQANEVPASLRRQRVPMSPESSNGHHGSKAMYNHLGADRQALRQIAATGQGPSVDIGHGFDGLGDFAKAALLSIARRVDDPRLKNLSEAIPSDGGILVPEEYRAELLMLALETAVIRPRARVIPMGAPSLRFPAIKDTSHATNVFGGVSGSWIAEAGTVSSTTNQPSFSAVRLVANKLSGYTVASNELLGDSVIALESLITTLFPQALSYFEDDAFFSGTGAGQPMGILNADALVTVAKEGGQSATTIVWENILNMYSRMLPQSHGSAVWIAHQDTFPQLASMSLTVGAAGSAVWLNNGAAGPPMTILGRPVIFTENCETLGSAGDIYYCDLSYYLIGDRQALTMAASEHVNFTTDEIVWKFVQRVDGRPWVVSALTPRNGSSTISPFVNLAVRA